MSWCSSSAWFLYMIDDGDVGQESRSLVKILDDGRTKEFKSNSSEWL